MPRRLAGVLGALALGACLQSAAPDITIRVEPGQTDTLELAPGQVVRYGQALVMLVGVADDSRCPVDVTCVWAGDATVALTIGPAAGPGSPLAVTLVWSDRGRIAQAWDVWARLVRVLPEAREGRVIAAEAYRVVLEIGVGSGPP